MGATNMETDGVAAPAEVQASAEAQAAGAPTAAGADQADTAEPMLNGAVPAETADVAAPVVAAETAQDLLLAEER